MTNSNVMQTSPGQTRLVLDGFRKAAAIIANDVVPSSYEENVFNGVENTSTSLSSLGPKYTTLPLSPISGNCLDVSKSFINVKLPMTFQTKYTAKSQSAVQSLHIVPHLKSSALLISRYQILIGNSPIFTTTFARQESLLTYNSLPEPYLINNPNFAPLKSIKDHSQFSGFVIKQPVTYTQQNPTVTKNWGCNLDLNIDLEVLNTILSNIPFITPEFGRLSLRIYFEDLSQAFTFVAYVPGVTRTFEVLPVGSVEDQFKVKLYTKSPASDVQDQENSIELSCTLLGWGANATTTPTGNPNFAYTTPLVSICQSCFSINETSRESIREYIAQNNNQIIIPTTILSTQLSTGAMLASGANGATQNQIFELSASNISALFVTLPYKSYSPTYLPNPRITNLSMTLNGKSLVSTPYDIIGSRAVKNFTQCLLDDDVASSSSDLLNSLYCLPTGVDDVNYNSEEYLSIYGTNSVIQNDATSNGIDRPNSFCICQKLTPPKSFEKGYMITSRGSGTAQFKLNFKTSGSTGFDGNSKISLAPGAYGDSDVYGNEVGNTICTALLDGALVLNYNVSSMQCTSGGIEFAAI